MTEQSKQTPPRRMQAGVMGWPVGQSLSPRLHGWWLKRYGIEGSYVPLPVPPEGLERALKELHAQGFRGVNLTVPHKEAALKYLDHVEPLAQRIGAVNTVVVRADGALEGRNTDVFGFAQNLHSAHYKPGTRAAVILGAGGAACAGIAALLDMGVGEIRIVNRTAERTEALIRNFSTNVNPSRHPREDGGPSSAVETCESFQRRMPAGVYPGPRSGAGMTQEGRFAEEKKLVAFSWNDLAHALEDAELLINATSLGMKGQEPLEIMLDALPKDALVTDMVYAPLETALLKTARGRGNPALDGLGMLLHQARPAFAAFFGVDPEVTDDLRRFVLMPQDRKP